ncbi:hypothetical protein LOC67_17005 [Stieleria sp. JC731]|uniref:hypothetical protein n=1 Tax=Pirellulaceae TaxID=2691357 RepID=UPI001E40EA1B|nr:hypothetical protein [Stieleria sp. JC731]MCC9602257.1 hypothetical protein [Stieleria sp. JC731]
MDHKNKTPSNLSRLAIVSAILLIVAICGLLGFVTVTSRVSGTASLPNGTKAIINGPFSCSCNSPTTEIEAGGHLFAFSPTTISVDGKAIGPLDATVTDVTIDATYWNASLYVNGTEVAFWR